MSEFPRPRDGVAPSAKGLFRAAGNTGRDDAREEHDFYPTPPEPTRALLAAERPALNRFSTIWEPAAGDGAMVREIRAAGWACLPSDLVDRGCGATELDFLAASTPLAAAIVTNPPYRLVNARDGRGFWVAHALGTLGVRYMALLLNWNWFCAAGLDRVLAAFPPARVYAITWKVDFTGAGAPPMNSGWVVWDDRHDGPTQLLRLGRAGDARQGGMFEGDA